MNIFRPLNENEKSVLRSADLKDRIRFDDLRMHYIDGLEVSYEFMQGGFCVCIIKLDLYSDTGRSITLWRGASRRSYKDRRNRTRGEMLAFSRAVLYSHPVEI